MNPERETRLVPVKVFVGTSARVDAELAKSLLEAEGIDCVLSSEIAAETIPVLEIPLLVREDDLRRAALTLEDGLSDSGAPDSGE
jgi:hypothetical protein